MTADEHYQEAERLLLLAEELANPNGDNEHDQLVARAHVHAVLAQREVRNVLRELEKTLR